MEYEMEEIGPDEDNFGIRKALRLIDKKGYITKDEVKTFFQEMGGGYTDEQVDRLYWDVDVNERETAIDMKEFLAMVQLQLTLSETEDEVVASFKMFDKEQNGFADCNDLRIVMEDMGEKLSAEEIDEFIVRSDLDCDGSVNYEEFTRIMMKERKFMTRTEREEEEKIKLKEKLKEEIELEEKKKKVTILGDSKA